MSDNFFFTQKVPYSGFNPPQDYDQNIHKKTSNDRRKETPFSYMDCDGNGFKTVGLKLEEKGINEPKTGPLESETEKGTFWTVCPYCYYMYEYEDKYEECCLLCQYCRRGFHGAPVAAAPERMLVKGEESYYCSGYGFFPLGYSGDDFLGDKKKFGERDTGKKHDVVEISDSSGDDEDKVTDVKIEAVRMKTEEGLSNGEGRRGVMKRVKSVPSNSKKLMGRGVKRMIQKVNVAQLDVEFGNGVADIGSGSGGGTTRLGSGSDQNGGCNEGDLEFFEGDDDIFVGLKDIC